MKFALALLLLAGFAHADSYVSPQSEASKKLEAQKIIRIFKVAKVSSLQCFDSKGILAIDMSPKQSDADTTGLTMDGNYSYGANDIKEITFNDTLTITYGEEGNFTFVMRDFAWSLFGLQSRESQPVATNEKVRATIINEDDMATQVVCSLKKN